MGAMTDARLWCQPFVRQNTSWLGVPEQSLDHGPYMLFSTGQQMTHQVHRRRNAQYEAECNESLDPSDIPTQEIDPIARHELGFHGRCFADRDRLLVQDE